VSGVASGLAHIHAHDIIHGDIRPKNVYLDRDMRPHIGDFWLAETNGGEEVSQDQGPCGFRAPELMMGGARTKASDVYAFGMLMVEVRSCLRCRRTCGDRRLTGSSKSIRCYPDMHPSTTCSTRLQSSSPFSKGIALCLGQPRLEVWTIRRCGKSLRYAGVPTPHYVLRLKKSW